MSTTLAATAPAASDATESVDLDALKQVEQRILWLATRIVDHANRERPKVDGLKVGGHQASCASMTSIMTALWFAHLNGNDRIAVKPHSSPVLHAIQYLLGNLDRDDLKTLREFKGLQAYPSITKDSFDVDFSTGSVGFGAVAPLFAAVTRRYVDEHFGPRPDSRFIALLGDAELDEGNIWEAMTDPISRGELGNVTWIIDLNRQSLDRVVPGVKAGRMMQMFEINDWQVIEAKYGRRLTAAMEAEGGDALRAHIDDMRNERYQRSLGMQGSQLREFFLDGADQAVVKALADVPDNEFSSVVHDLGGHDLATLLDAYRTADAETERPSVVFAYTIKGYGLPMAGDPLNHAALLSGEQIDELRPKLADPDDEWHGFADDTEPGRIIATATTQLQREPYTPTGLDIEVPDEVGMRPTRAVSTQASFGRLVARLGKVDDLAPRLVTTSPDVAVSTGLAGWINKVGVFHHTRATRSHDSGLLRWVEEPTGQHIELGISEMNLFSMLGQLGDAERLHGERLVPIGTLYDPFVCRGLDALIHSLYSDTRFIFAGTPSGVSLSPEGGAHQSSVTASLGIELPNIVSFEPTFVGAMDWLLCDMVDDIANQPTGDAAYFRLTTRDLDQSPFERAIERVGEDLVRADVIAGAYRLMETGEGGDGPRVTLCTCGPVVPEVLTAAEDLAAEGLAVRVVDITSLDRLYRGWRETMTGSIRRARRPRRDFHLQRVLGRDSGPLVTVHDASPHAMGWLGSAVGQPVVPLGVDTFGQSGTVADLYDEHDLTAGMVANAALAALDLT